MSGDKFQLTSFEDDRILINDNTDPILEMRQTYLDSAIRAISNCLFTFSDLIISQMFLVGENFKCSAPRRTS